MGDSKDKIKLSSAVGMVQKQVMTVTESLQSVERVLMADHVRLEIFRDNSSRLQQFTDDYIKNIQSLLEPKKNFVLSPQSNHKVRAHYVNNNFQNQNNAPQQQTNHGLVAQNQMASDFQNNAPQQQQANYGFVAQNQLPSDFQNNAPQQQANHGFVAQNQMSSDFQNNAPQQQANHGFVAQNQLSSDFQNNAPQQQANHGFVAQNQLSSDFQNNAPQQQASHGFVAQNQLSSDFQNNAPQQQANHGFVAQNQLSSDFQNNGPQQQANHGFVAQNQLSSDFQNNAPQQQQSNYGFVAQNQMYSNFQNNCFVPTYAQYQQYPQQIGVPMFYTQNPYQYHNAVMIENAAPNVGENCNPSTVQNDASNVANEMQTLPVSVDPNTATNSQENNNNIQEVAQNQDNNIQEVAQNQENNIQEVAQNQENNIIPPAPYQNHIDYGQNWPHGLIMDNGHYCNGVFYPTPMQNETGGAPNEAINDLTCTNTPGSFIQERSSESRVQTASQDMEELVETPILVANVSTGIESVEIASNVEHTGNEKISSEAVKLHDNFERLVDANIAPSEKECTEEEDKIAKNESVCQNPIPKVKKSADNSVTELANKQTSEETLTDRNAFSSAVKNPSGESKKKQSSKKQKSGAKPAPSNTADSTELQAAPERPPAIVAIIPNRPKSPPSLHEAIDDLTCTNTPGSFIQEISSESRVQTASQDMEQLVETPILVAKVSTAIENVEIASNVKHTGNEKISEEAGKLRDDFATLVDANSGSAKSAKEFTEEEDNRIAKNETVCQNSTPQVAEKFANHSATELANKQTSEEALIYCDASSSAVKNTSGESKKKQSSKKQKSGAKPGSSNTADSTELQAAPEKPPAIVAIIPNRPMSPPSPPVDSALPTTSKTAVGQKSKPKKNKKAKKQQNLKKSAADEEEENAMLDRLIAENVIIREEMERAKAEEVKSENNELMLDTLAKIAMIDEKFNLDSIPEAKQIISGKGRQDVFDFLLGITGYYEIPKECDKEMITNIENIDLAAQIFKKLLTENKEKGLHKKVLQEAPNYAQLFQNTIMGSDELLPIFIFIQLRLKYLDTSRVPQDVLRIVLYISLLKYYSHHFLPGLFTMRIAFSSEGKASIEDLEDKFISLLKYCIKFK